MNAAPPCPALSAHSRMPAVIRSSLAAAALIAAVAPLTVAAGCHGGSAREAAPFDGAEFVSVEVSLDQTLLTDDDSEALVAVDVTAREASEAWGSAHIAVVIDASGSMEGARMEDARAAAHALIDGLDPADSLTLISFGDSATVHVAGARMRRERAHAHAAVDELVAEGNTCTSCGLQAAYDVLQGARSDGLLRVILVSDGHANRGLTDDASLRGMALAYHEQVGVDTTTIGLGRLVNDVSLAAIAEAGAANYYFIPSSSEMDEVLGTELARAHRTAVQGLRVRLVPGDGVRIAEVLNTGATWNADSVEFDLGQLAAGEMRTLLVRVALPTGDMGRALTARATFLGGSGRVYEVSAAGRVERTDDPAAAKASLDPDVATAFALLRSAQQIEQAMSLVESGDRAAAIEELAANREDLDAYAVAPSVQAEIDQLDEMIEFYAGVETGSAAAAAPERTSVLSYRAQAAERRRGTPRSQAYNAPSVATFADE
ncbi:MAG: VWA domain-containing protein [Myxococcales bacterium]|nr:VWA domain-containing protein [Myxococcales bacterium]MCB9519398.1 VWA domain-containing protein [Myxococcales bacterium]MCB9531297.1 VWA domain-containing protein [Myxococcales bacterium]